jgi:hypothetical protein
MVLLIFDAYYYCRYCKGFYKKAPGMPAWTPIKWTVRMISVRVMAIITPAAVAVRRPVVWPVIIMPYHCIAVVIYFNVLTVINIYIDVVVARINISITAIYFGVIYRSVRNIGTIFYPCIV